MLHIGPKIWQKLGKQQGQSLVEAALLMCFAAALVLAINWDGFRDTAGNAYTKMAGSLGTKTSIAENVESYKTMSNAELKEIDNAQRVAMDQNTLTVMCSKFLGMSMDEIKKIFGTNNEKLLQGQASNNKHGVIVFDYSIVNTGDDGNGVKINLRQNGEGSVSNREAMQWMQGNYNTNSADYSKNPEDISYRLFFSDAAIDQTPNKEATGVQSATVRAYFSFENGKVNKVTVNMTRSYQDSNKKWVRMECDDFKNLVIQ